MKKIGWQLLILLLITGGAEAGRETYLMNSTPGSLKVFVDSNNVTLVKEALEKIVYKRLRAWNITPVAGFASADNKEVDLNIIVDGKMFNKADSSAFLVNVYFGTKVERYGFVSTETACHKFGYAREKAVLDAVNQCLDEILPSYIKANQITPAVEQ